MKFLTLLLPLFFVMPLFAQDDDLVRYIEVRGMAETEIEADEMTLFITIQEYWEEEFEKRKDPEDYKTKVPLARIEDSVIQSIRKADIDMEEIRVGSIGNYWREQGKEFLFSKQLEIKITDFAKVNQLVSLLDSRGIKSMNIGNYDHSDMDAIEKKVKVDALTDAREKAQLMLESLGEELGEVLSVSEISNGYVRPLKAETRMFAADMSMESIDQVKKITVSYQVDVRFRIK